MRALSAILAQRLAFPLGGEGFEGATLGIFVENNTTGAPVPGIDITMNGFGFDGNDVTFSNGQTSITVTSDADGVSEFTDLPPGDYFWTSPGDADFFSQGGQFFIFQGTQGFLSTPHPIVPNE